jgi:iron complex transport system substrate-binding protein
MNRIRRARGLVLAGLLLIMLPAACAGGGATETEVAAPTEAVAEAAPTEAAAAEPTDAPAAEAESPTGETRAVTDAAGNELTIPAAPRRVVVLSERDMDAAFALGFPVVGVVNGRGAEAPPAYLQPYLGEAVSVGAFSEPSPEAILNLNPDLILIGGLFPALEEMLPAFQEIAPVYVTFNSGDDWRAAFLGAADALNQTAAAEAWLADYDAAAAELAAQLPAGSEVSIVRFNPDGPVIMAPGSFAGTITSSLGLARPESHLGIEGAGHGDTVSLEALPTIDADHLFAGALNPEGTAVLEAALADPLYAALSAVQNDAVSVVDGAVWTSLGGPLAARAVLSDVAAAFGVAQ